MSQATRVATSLTVLVFLLSALPPAVTAQSAEAPATVLELGKPIERELAAGQVHVYTVRLEAGQYLGAFVEQKSVDVVITVLGPDGSKLREFDRPDGAGGTETVRFVARLTGTHRLEVRSFDAALQPGRYEARLDEVRASAETDRVVVEADALYAQSATVAGDGTSPEAVALAERALTLYEKVLGAEHPDVGTALSNLGWLHHLARDFEKAEPLYVRSLAIREKALGPNHYDVAEVLKKLSLTYVEVGAYPTAEAFQLRALAIQESVCGADHPVTISSFSGLAKIYVYEGLYAKAEPLLVRAIAIQEKNAAESSGLGDNLNSLGLLYTYGGLYAKAEPVLLRSLAIREKVSGPESLDVAPALNNLAVVYFHQELYAKAEPLWERALAIVEKTLGNEHPYATITLTNLAEVYRNRRLYEKAEQVLTRAIAAFEKTLGPDHPQLAVAVNNLGMVYLSSGDYAKAEPQLRRAIDIRERVLGAEHPDVVGSWNNLAANLAAAGRVGEALDAHVRANDARESEITRNLLGGSERDKLQYLALTRGDVDRTVSLHTLAAPADPRACRAALEVVLRRKGRALDAMTDQMAALRRHAAPEDVKLLDALETARSRLSASTLAGPGEAGVERHRADLKALDTEVDALEGQVSRRSAEFRVQSTPVTLDAVQKAVPAGAALVEFASYRPFDPKAPEDSQYGAARYAAYVLFAKGDPTWVDLGAAEPIDSAVTQFRAALRDPGRDDVRRLSRALDSMLMQPVRALLGDTATLLVSPDGALNLIPFAALVDERDRYLAERFAITYVTSGRDLLRLQEHVRSRSGALVVAAPNFQLAGADDAPVAGTRAVDVAKVRFNALPATALEAREVSRLLKSTPLTGARASESSVKRAAGPRVMHVATHGFFFDRSEVTPAGDRGAGGAGSDIQGPLLRSGLAFSGANRRDGGNGEDGILTALEAAGLDLWGTELVVLSACDTGLGETSTGDGVYGLRRALVLSGSRTQVMSLWAVDDRVTRELMVAYYKELFAGAGRSEAMRRVQLAMLKSPETRHPAYWAAFIVSGDWRPLD